METSKIGFSNIDNTAFEGRRKKVKKEHPKREKIKENAKKMALFLAGLASLGIATVAITSKNNEPQIKEETHKKNDENQAEKEPPEKKEPPKKQDAKIIPAFKYQKALPAPKEKIYLLPMPKHEESTTEEGSDKKEAALSKTSLDHKAKEVLGETSIDKITERTIQNIQAKDEDFSIKLNYLLEKVAETTPQEQDEAAESGEYQEHGQTDSEEGLDPLDLFIAHYEEIERAAAERQKTALDNQLKKISGMLEDSISDIQEGLPVDTKNRDDLTPSFDAEVIVPPVDFSKEPIDLIVSEMLSGIYGKNAQNAVEHHLDKKAYKIYQEMNPSTVYSLPVHFIEMTIVRDSMGNSNKGMLKRLQGLEKKFTPEGIKKIVSTEEGRTRLLRYVVGIEYVNPKSLSGNSSIMEKVSDIQKTVQAKKENLTWLKKAAEE